MSFESAQQDHMENLIKTSEQQIKSKACLEREEQEKSLKNFYQVF